MQHGCKVEYHHACYEAEENSVCHAGHAAAIQKEVANETSNGLRDTRSKSPEKGLPTRACGIVYWHGHTDAFRDVVESNGKRDSESIHRVRQSSNKCGEPFWEVVNANGKGRHETHLLESEAVVIVGEVQIDCVSCFFGHVCWAVCEMDRCILYMHSS
jgi:hypothetical protein